MKMNDSKGKKYFFKKGVLWLGLATIFSFADELVQEHFSNSIFLNLAMLFVLITWLVFLFYWIKFYIKSDKMKWFN